ncbi:PUA-like domain-containing protein [Endogone sp. FLAS-F59071]|nr:PUA-like domain-containing protein [Endogone sp. FLAS-F59071]|eukprot:RUS13915.1 PUA-like domain-containing protein [Endogone sp. FLAS-F59071]
MAKRSELSEYEIQRERNIAENRKVLEALGVTLAREEVRAVAPTPIPKGGDEDDYKAPKKKRKGSRAINTYAGEILQEQDRELRVVSSKGSRRSSRLSSKPNGPLVELHQDFTDDDEEKPRLVKKWTGGHVFGPIPGIEIGHCWDMRVDCCTDGVHRATVAGIAGSESEGCYSVALSGGYEDDIDLGEAFTYTGSGGRDLKGTSANPKNLRTAAQSKDQTLVGGNKALKISYETKKPVRVIRGYKLNSPYAPDEGYRYDGLYTVENFWQARGLSNFMVYKYAFKRVPGQPPLPVVKKTHRENAQALDSESKENNQEAAMEVKEAVGNKKRTARKGQVAHSRAESTSEEVKEVEKEVIFKPLETKRMTSRKGQANEDITGSPEDEFHKNEVVVEARGRKRKTPGKVQADEKDVKGCGLEPGGNSEDVVAKPAKQKRKITRK